MENYFKNLDKKSCNGCGVCALKCPKNAITMEEDGEGFLYPVINKEKCINCGLCEKICSNNVKDNSQKANTYIAINKNKDVKRSSSSGGMFYPIAENIIGKNGVVFGVIFDKNLIAKHIYAENLEDIKKFQGSKYVRSDLNNSYEKAEEFLKANRYVLFTGTPCQCQGLRSYLGREYDKLITCEIVCHANPSPKVFKLYKNNLEKLEGKSVKNIHFRSKENGWRNQTPIIEYTNGVKKEENSYFKAFVDEMINRPSCYNCNFCTEKRYSDFSIADFWGIEKVDKEIVNDDTGISLFNVNTEKGRKLLEEFKEEIFLKNVDTTLAFSYNHHCNVLVHKNREKFFNGISDGSINETNVIKYMRKYTKKPLYRRVLGKVKRIVKKIIKR